MSDGERKKEREIERERDREIKSKDERECAHVLVKKRVRKACERDK